MRRSYARFQRAAPSRRPSSCRARQRQPRSDAAEKTSGDTRLLVAGRRNGRRRGEAARAVRDVIIEHPLGRGNRTSCPAYRGCDGLRGLSGPPSRLAVFQDPRLVLLATALAARAPGQRAGQQVRVALARRAAAHGCQPLRALRAAPGTPITGDRSQPSRA